MGWGRFAYAFMETCTFVHVFLMYYDHGRRKRGGGGLEGLVPRSRDISGGRPPNKKI